MTVTIRVGVLLGLAALSASVVGDAATASAATRSAVYGGTLGSAGIAAGTGRLLRHGGPCCDALTGIGLTFNASYLGGTNAPVTLAVSRVESTSAPAPPGGVRESSSPSATVAAGSPEPSPTPIADGGRTTLEIAGRLTRDGALPERCLRTTFSCAGVLTCDLGTRRWRAQRRPGRIFAGNLRVERHSRARARDGRLAIQGLPTTTWLWTARRAVTFNELRVRGTMSGDGAFDHRRAPVHRGIQSRRCGRSAGART